MNRLKQWLRDPLIIAIIAVLVLLAIGEALSPGFASPDQVVRLLTVAAILGIVSAGQNLVILGGGDGIDLSVGAMISLGAFVAGNIMDGKNGGILPAILLASLVTFLIGLLNGLGVTLLRIPPLIMTLGMTAVVQGGLVVFSQGVPSGNAAPMLMNFVNHSFALGLPGILAAWALVGVLMWFVLRRTAFGYAIYAIGANERAAGLVGIPVTRVRALLYGLSGLFAGFAGVCVIGYTGNSFLSIGDQYVLPSVIAVVIGGTSLAGGAGLYAGTMTGAVALVVLQSILTTLHMEAWGRQIIFGITLLALMLAYGRQKQLRV